MKHAVHGHSAAGDLLDFQKLITELQAAVSQSVNGVMLRGNLPRPFQSGHGNAINLVGSGTPGRLVGLEAWETSGANGILLRFYDGPAAVGDGYTDKLIAAIPLSANANTNREYQQVSFINGLTLVLTALDGVSNPSGTVEGVVTIGAAHP